ncbi:hypothetical protein BDZ31_002963 [Conexibacter arvalis]|uniref:Uncharacterized protein n=2 Tax=Conexibacter arvalis TaxID=912552 RepID=A0A840IHE0_9ACTN|nr:hypothetical protein [Conexibacter arvalis]
MMGLAVWHFTVFIPDHFWGGIVGAFLAAMFGAIVFGLVVNGFSIPGNDDVSIMTAAEGIPGGALGLAACYFEGLRRERKAGVSYGL